jgi:peptide/nickel transport system ATP-binding protein
MICDEAVAALDVSVQAQVLNLFMKLREERHLTYLFISHDLGVVRHLTDRVMIMYLGRIVEQGQTSEIFSHPNHPYTKALISHIPEIKLERKLFSPIEGEIPSSMSPPTGCHFHPRCPYAMKICSERQPLPIEVSPNHYSACHLNSAS